MKKLRYYPELNEATGGITSTILMLQLEYWFERVDGEAFFKFLEPCEALQYRGGDSWCEETGFSKGEFRTAFGRIGKVYKSKREFTESQDKFEGKMYLSYFDRIKKLTFYMRNPEVVEQYLNLEEEAKLISTSEETVSGISLDYAIPLPQDKKSTTPYEEIIKIYHETCPDLPKVSVLSSWIKGRIAKIWHNVSGDIQRIQEVFSKLHASDFLSGRIAGKTWRADLAWVMQTDKFEEVLRDKYALNYENLSKGKETIPSKGKSKGKSKIRRFGNMLSHNWDFAQLEGMEEQHRQEKAEHYKGLESALLYKLAEINSDLI